MLSEDLSLPPLLTWEQIDPHLNWPAIRAATEPTTNEQNPFVTEDTSRAFRMVCRALVRWAARDLYTMNIEQTEGHFVLQDPADGSELSHGFIDLELTLIREYKELAANLIGKKFIVDWKTSKGQLDAIWAGRLRDSWQGKLYTLARNSQHIIFRGISQNEDYGERELIFEMPPAEEISAQVLQQFRLYQRTMEMYNASTLPETPSWPRHMPYACGAYKRTCPNKLDCETNTAPFIVFPPEVLAKPMSYSSGERMALCPEKHRRYLALREGLDPTVPDEEDGDEEDTDETTLGNAVHRGLQEAYNQLRELRKKGVL